AGPAGSVCARLGEPAGAGQAPVEPAALTPAGEMPRAPAATTPPAGLGLPAFGATPEEGDEPAPAAPSPPKKGFRLKATWDNGLWLDSPDDQFHIHVGGNSQIDTTWLIGPHGVFAIPGGGMNGVENAAATMLRRVRLRLEGDLYDQFDYIIEYDFA